MSSQLMSVTRKLAENSTIYDLFVVGGGINGTGIAADASGRGLTVALCEQADLASATSSASSKLIHGGLRYLEHYEFRLVREALAEREVLLNNAPHLIEPLRFILPHRPHLRPAWMIRIGLFMYDHLSPRNQLAGSRGVKLQANDSDNPLNSRINYGFEYADCRVDDARLVVSNALAARAQGANIMVRTRCVSARRQNGLWHLWLEDQLNGQQFSVRARGLVNAAGPWAQQFFEQQIKSVSPRKIRLIKGSHIVTRKLYQGDQAYILQNEDQRIVFVIPYNGAFTLIGTTDKPYEGDPSKVEIDQDEEQYLLNIVNAHFKQPITSDDILWRYSGVRPLCDDESASPSAMTRDYTLEIQADDHHKAPLLSVFGGKITTYRRLADAALQALKPYYPAMGASWNRNAPLPGGNIDQQTFTQWQHALQHQYPWLPDALCRRLCRAYGTRIHLLLQGCISIDDLGQHFGSHLYQREVEYLLEEEWARSADDILWRRSKLGLHMNQDQTCMLQQFVVQHIDSMSPEESDPFLATPVQTLRQTG